MLFRSTAHPPSGSGTRTTPTSGPPHTSGGAGTGGGTSSRPASATSGTPAPAGGQPEEDPADPSAVSRRRWTSRRVGGFDCDFPEETGKNCTTGDPNALFRRILREDRDAHRVGSEPTPPVRPFHLQGPAGARDAPPLSRVAPLQGRDELEEEKTRVILARMAESTQRTYDNQWRWWELFCKRRGIDPIRIVSDQQRDQEENLFLDFVVHCAANVPRSAPTIRTRLSAIRAHHATLGLPDPLSGMKRVELLLQGYARLRGAPPRRHPVTPRMLRWIRTGLRIENNLNDAVLWAALLLGFFFLLRASEYLAPEVETPSAKGIRGSDLVPRRGGTPVESYSEADEVVLTIRGSKTDILNEGHRRNHFRVEGDLCVVEALEHLQRLAPERCTTAREEYLLKWRDGRPDRKSTRLNSSHSSVSRMPSSA